MSIARAARVALAAAIALVACVPTHDKIPRTPDAADVENKTVALVAERPGLEGIGVPAYRAYCSGVWVGPKEILTAAHCVTDGDAVEYMTRDDLQPPEAPEIVRAGEVASRDEDHDLALIRVHTAPDHPVARIGREPTVGQHVQTMGHPLGLWWSYSTGVIGGIRQIALDPFEDPSWYIQSTAPISPGNSGGALFDDYGEVLGICHAYMPRGENVNLYIHQQYVEKFLEKAL